MRIAGTKIHFIGIGGIGMSALAHIAAARGAVVSGCDRSESYVIDGLRAKGIECCIGHSPEHVREIDILVRSSAIRTAEDEVRAAEKESVPVVRRARMLDKLMDGHKGIAIAGAHGKTTTTWITANIFIRAGFDPTVMIGGLVSDLNGNYRCGRSNLFITEADESDRSLLELNPKHVLLTNIDREHLDNYRDINDIKSTFRSFAEKIPRDGSIVACIDGTGVEDVLDACGCRVVTCGCLKKAHAMAQNVRYVPGGSQFDVVWRGRELRDITLSLPGEHNVQNALLAIAFALEFGVPDGAIREALAHTCTVHRRFETKGSERGITIIDDYAHHPTEIEKLLATARSKTTGRLIGVFQPHRYSRTAALYREFARALQPLDHLVLTEIYGADEDPVQGVSAEMITRAMTPDGPSTDFVERLEEVPEHLFRILQPGDTVITIGAGSVGTLGEKILQKLRS